MPLIPDGWRICLGNTKAGSIARTGKERQAVDPTPVW